MHGIIIDKSLGDCILTTSVTPKDVKIFVEDGMPYLDYTGEVKTSKGVSARIHIPKMSLQLKTIECSKEEYYNEGYNARSHPREFYRWETEIFCGGDCGSVSITPVKRECRLEDLERELGYKINIKE